MYKKQRKHSTSVVVTDVTIFEAMITEPSGNPQSKSFYVKVESEEESFKTQSKKGSNPKWKFRQVITSKNGRLIFKLIEKSGFLG